MIAKRLFDITIAITLLLITSPVIVLLALAIKLDSPGTVFFRQQRIGQYCHPFILYKFRSMVENTATVGPYFTDWVDTRITRVGTFIRRTSLDELPQLFNVLLGDMSLVGPRPDLPLQRSNYNDQEWLQRHQIKPGITGLAQATLRSHATTEQRKALDLEYVTKASFSFDLKILLLTVRQVLLKGGH